MGEDVLTEAQTKRQKEVTRRIVGVLCDIRSLHNVGSMFRTADAGGVAHLYLVGYTPTPLDRFGRKRKEITKIALGGEETVPWSPHADVTRLLEELKQEGYQIVAYESGQANGQSYDQALYGEKVALVVGNEVEGLSTSVLEHADVIAEIPLYGKKESLNVSVAFGIALYEMRRTPH